MANKRLNATIQIGGTVSRTLTRGITNTNSQIGELGQTIATSSRQQANLSREIRSMGRRGMNVEPLRRQYAKLSDEIDEARRKQAALRRIAEADVGGKFRTMTTEVGRLARRTAMLGTAAAGGIFAIASSTSSLGDNIAKTADKLGIGTTALQELRYAAEQSGVGAGVLDTAMQRMVRRVSEAAQGTGAAKDAIAELGLSAEALASMTPDEQMRHIADAMADVTNQGDRVRLAMKLFDTEGVAMVNMLRQGAQGLDELGDAAHRVGYVLSEEATRDAEKFQDNLTDVKLSLGGLKNIIGSALMPVVSDMMGQFTGWLAENRDQVREWSATFSTRLKAAIPAIEGLATGIGKVVLFVGRAVTRTAELVGGFDNLGMIVGGLFASKAIVAVGAFVVSLVKAGMAFGSLTGILPVVAKGIGLISKALFMNPIGLTLMAVAGAGYLIYRNWSSIGPWFSGLWDGIKEGAAWAWDKIKTVFGWTPLGLIINNWDSIKGWFSGLWDGIKEGAALGWKALKGEVEWSPMSTISSAWGGVTGWLGDVWEGAKRDAAAAWDWMAEKLSWSPLETISNAWGGLSEWFGELWDGITGAAERALDWITGKLEWVGNAFSKVKGWITWGDDDDADEIRAQLGGGNTGAVGLSSNSESRAESSRRAIEQQAPTQAGPARPQFSERPTAAERGREVVNNITNNLTLNVTRREGEADASYADRIAEMVMDRLNERQQGALFDV